MHDQLTEAIAHVAEHGGTPMTFEVGPRAAIRLAEGTGHLLTDATITHWTVD